jgi:hypothetical protein
MERGRKKKKNKEEEEKEGGRKETVKVSGCLNFNKYLLNIH